MPGCPCDSVFMPVQSPLENLPTSVRQLTDVVGFEALIESGATLMPAVKITVQLSFSGGSKSVIAAESPAIELSPRSDERTPPYRLVNSTVPEEPALIASSSFIQIG